METRKQSLVPLAATGNDDIARIAMECGSEAAAVESLAQRR
jgi:hypothetical protein